MDYIVSFLQLCHLLQELTGLCEQDVDTGWYKFGFLISPVLGNTTHSHHNKQQLVEEKIEGQLVLYQDIGCKSNKVDVLKYPIPL